MSLSGRSRSQHGLARKHERLLRLQETARERKLRLTDEQIRAPERFSPEFRERRTEVHFSSEHPSGTRGWSLAPPPRPNPLREHFGMPFCDLKKAMRGAVGYSPALLPRTNRLGSAPPSPKPHPCVATGSGVAAGGTRLSDVIVLCPLIPR